ncbi:MAG: NAD(P)H-binding protein, partial [Chloroflexota bacterium]
MAWMIYGATGYTGQLVVAEAVARGHRPLLAGRNPEKLATLADTYDLDFVAFQLNDPTVIAEAIADMDVVYHAAGPFVYTSEPMIRACLATHTHYLDITGEIDVFEQTFRYD